MTETLTPNKVLIALVSGFGNTEKPVKEPHKEAAANLRQRGFTVVEVNPDYVSGSYWEARNEISAARNTATESGLHFVSFGTSAGGTVATAERIEHALKNGTPSGELGIIPFADKGITVCSRNGLSNHPDKYGDRYPNAQAIKDSSRLLGEAAEFVGTHLEVVVFSKEDTLCLTAGPNDNRIPPESSYLPNAKVSFISASNGTRLTHDGAVGRVLESPVYRERIANFAIGKAA